MYQCTVPVQPFQRDGTAQQPISASAVPETAQHKSGSVLSYSLWFFLLRRMRLKVPITRGSVCLYADVRARAMCGGDVTHLNRAIYGDRMNCSRLLLKVTRKRRKIAPEPNPVLKPSQDPQDNTAAGAAAGDGAAAAAAAAAAVADCAGEEDVFVSELIGTIGSTYKFEGMADFQFIAAPQVSPDVELTEPSYFKHDTELRPVELPHVTPACRIGSTLSFKMSSAPPLSDAKCQHRQHRPRPPSDATLSPGCGYRQCGCRRLVDWAPDSFLPSF